MLGANWTHFDNGPFSNITLDPEVIATWGLPMWILAIAVFSLIAIIILNVCAHYHSIGLLSWYIVWGLLLYGALKWNTKRLKP